MANPVTVSDLEARWRPLTSEREVLNAQSMLDDVWAILTARLPALAGNVTVVPPATAPVVAHEVVVAVASAIALRVLRNPDGKIQEAIDDYSFRRSELLASGLLTATDDELGLLSPQGGTGGAFSITPYAAPAAVCEWWW